jgi:ABC-type amino acid transport substrate-binding protein
VLNFIIYSEVKVRTHCFAILFLLSLCQAGFSQELKSNSQIRQLHFFGIGACPWVCPDEDGRQIKGVLVDIVNEVFKKLPEYKVIISLANPTRMEKERTNEKVTGFIGADSKMKNIYPDGETLAARGGILILRNELPIPKNVPDVSKLDEAFLKDYKIGVLRDYIPTMTGDLSWYVRKYIDDPKRIVPVSSNEGYPSLLQMMDIGRVDLLIVEQALLDYYVKAYHLKVPKIIKKTPPRQFYPKLARGPRP